MKSPWLEIPLSDYEAHMALPAVGQAQLLAELFGSAMDDHRPRSVAMLGCAGGNGFERVIGIDINPDYIRRTQERFGDRLPSLELLVGDVQADTFTFEPVELIFAGLLFEYVDVGLSLARIRSMLCPNGTLVTVLQLPSPSAIVTPSPYTTLCSLSSVMRLVPPEQFQTAAEACGFRFVSAEPETAAGGKQFYVQKFRAAMPNPSVISGVGTTCGGVKVAMTEAQHHCEGASMADTREDPDVCPFFVGLERTLWEAVMHKNSDGLARLLARDYLEITLEGERLERSEIVSLSPQVDDILEYAIDLPKVTLLGENNAMLNYHLTLNGHCRGEPLRPRERWATSIWTQADDRWWCRFFQQSAFSVNHDSSNRRSP